MHIIRFHKFRMFCKSVLSGVPVAGKASVNLLRDRGVMNAFKIIINNVFLAFCYRCTSCGWKKRTRNMMTDTQCYACNGLQASAPRRMQARRVSRASMA